MSGALQGSVVREGSLLPIIGAYVRMNRLHASGRSSEDVRSIVTDDTGGFFADGLALGRWTVTLESGDDSLVQEVHVFNDAVSSVVFELPRRANELGYRGSVSVATLGAVHGHVVYISGRTVSDATVTVMQAAGPVPDIAPLTGADGSFTFDELPVGHWVLQALGPTSGASGKVEVDVRGGETSEVTIVLDGFLHPDSTGSC